MDIEVAYSPRKTQHWIGDGGGDGLRKLTLFSLYTKFCGSINLINCMTFCRYSESICTTCARHSHCDTWCGVVQDTSNGDSNLITEPFLKRIIQQ